MKIEIGVVGKVHVNSESVQWRYRRSKGWKE